MYILSLTFQIVELSHLEVCATEGHKTHSWKLLIDRELKTKIFIDENLKLDTFLSPTFG